MVRDGLESRRAVQLHGGLLHFGEEDLQHNALIAMLTGMLNQAVGDIPADAPDAVFLEQPDAFQFAGLGVTRHDPAAADDFAVNHRARNNPPADF